MGSGRLDELIAAAGPAMLYLCGGADNQLELADRFTRVFLLEIDEPTMLARLETRQDNERGRAGVLSSGNCSRGPAGSDVTGS
jgi:hypothetical protein